MAEVARALDYAHSHGVTHRDVKSLNVMIDRSGHVRLMDFGLAKHESHDEDLTAPGAVLGTIPYMSPEQASGRLGEVGPQSDVYSLGIVLYELLTGFLPFRGSTESIIRQVCETAPRKPTGLSPEIEKDLETICLKAIAKETGERLRERRSPGGRLAALAQRRADRRRAADAAQAADPLAPAAAGARRAGDDRGRLAGAPGRRFDHRVDLSKPHAPNGRAGADGAKPFTGPPIRGERHSHVRLARRGRRSGRVAWTALDGRSRNRVPRQPGIRGARAREHRQRAPRLSAPGLPGARASRLDATLRSQQRSPPSADGGRRPHGPRPGRANGQRAGCFPRAQGDGLVGRHSSRRSSGGDGKCRRHDPNLEHRLAPVVTHAGRRSPDAGREVEHFLPEIQPGQAIHRGRHGCRQIDGPPRRQ